MGHAGSRHTVTLYVMLCVMFYSVFHEVSQVLCGQCQCRAADIGPLQKSGTPWKILLLRRTLDQR